jgi:hypothetical protein
VLGYYGLFFGLQLSNDRAMLQKLDAGDYSGAETVTIKLPITIPYTPDAADFERVDGKFEHNGTLYRLVKQRYAQDTLHIVCIKDQDGTRISEGLTSYVKTFTDKPISNSKNSKTVDTLIKDYLTDGFSLTNASYGWELEVLAESLSVIFNSEFHSSISQPPESV